jgi:multidrug efflux pump subunit AcrA (membrane-fusion protein)
LINSGAQAAGKELFDIARVDPLRVYVSVPQAYAPSMKVGVKAAVTLQEFPGQKFTGTVVRTADAIDMATRTLNTEVDVPNKDGKLLPGSFGQVHFAVGNSVPRITIPVECHVVSRRGSAGRGGRQGRQSATAFINIGRDFGNTSKFSGVSTRAIGSLLIRPIRSRKASRFALPSRANLRRIRLHQAGRQSFVRLRVLIGWLSPGSCLPLRLF